MWTIIGNPFHLIIWVYLFTGLKIRFQEIGGMGLGWVGEIHTRIYPDPARTLLNINQRWKKFLI